VIETGGRGTQGHGSDQPSQVRLADHLLELVTRTSWREIDDRARGCGHTNAVPGRDLEGSPAMNPDALAARVARSRHRHFHFASAFGADAIERGGGRVTERRSGTAAQNRGHPHASHRALRRADGVHPRPQRVQAARSHLMLDGVGGEAERKQLGPRHIAMLLPRKRP
jgi:hypothetical protein